MASPYFENYAPKYLNGKYIHEQIGNVLCFFTYITVYSLYEPVNPMY